MTTDRAATLFLCTGNACRSQMAEGWARHLDPEGIYLSAGIETHGLNPHAVAVMREAGVDISYHSSKTLDDIPEIDRIDLVVTVCDHASENCPVFPADATVIHRGFPDPPKLAKALEDPEEQLDCYRRVRDDIRAFVVTELPRLTAA
ncbi:MAG: arsenate reductase ArsC [Pseudomonadota bacterium]